MEISSSADESSSPASEPDVASQLTSSEEAEVIEPTHELPLPSDHDEDDDAGSRTAPEPPGTETDASPPVESADIISDADAPIEPGTSKARALEAAYPRFKVMPLRQPPPPGDNAGLIDFTKFPNVTKMIKIDDLSHGGDGRDQRDLKTILDDKDVTEEEVYVPPLIYLTF